MPGVYMITGGYVATLDDSLGDIPNGAVLVNNGLITAVGSVEEVKAQAQATAAESMIEVIDARNSVIIPGMVDTHRHCSMSLTRGLGADQSLMQFLSNTYMHWLPATEPEDMYNSGLVGALEALDSGVTTVLDSCESFHSRAHAEGELRGLQESGIRAFFCYGMSDDAYGPDNGVGLPGWSARLAHVDELRATNKPKNLVQVGMALSAPGSVPFNLTAAEIQFAEQHKLLCCSHSNAFHNSCLTKGIEERADHGLLLPGHVYIHCASLSAHEMKLIAESGGKVSIATETEMQMGMGIPPIRACVEAGLKPTLSIDTSAAVAPDLLSQMRLALQMQRCLDNDRAHKDRKFAMDCEYGVRDALIWGTRNGAEAVGLGDLIGTLTPGKEADIVMISTKRGLSASAYPLGTAVLHSTPADVEMVMVKGEIRKRDGKLLREDLAEIRAKATEGLQRILKGLEKVRSEMSKEELDQ